MSPQLQAATVTPPDLSRELGVSHAIAIVVGTIIGSGIFLVPAEMMQAVGSARLVFLAWLLGGILSFAGVPPKPEWAAMKPKAGVEYVYARDVYGPLAGFLYAGTTFLISNPASIATVTTGFVRILGTFSIFSFLRQELVSQPFAITSGQLVAVLAAVLIATLHYVGVKKVGGVHLQFTVLQVAMSLGTLVT